MRGLPFYTIFTLLFAHTSIAFQALVGRRYASTTRLFSSNSFQNFDPFRTKDASSRLISELAVIALKLRLADHTDVRVDLDADPTNLIQRGRIGPVFVKGKGWQSGLGLSCRAIEASVETCELDAGRIVADRKIVLTTPAKGRAMVAMTGNDFGSFITHPLLRPPLIDDEAIGKVEFVKTGATVNPKTGAVTFTMKVDGEGIECQLRRGVRDGERNAVVEVVSPPSLVATSTSKLSESLTDFFNSLTFELDGTYLTFRDMTVVQKESPLLLLSLDILVKKFPSPGTPF